MFDDEKFRNFILFGAYGTDEELGAAAPFLIVFAIIVIVLIVIFS